MKVTKLKWFAIRLANGTQIAERAETHYGALLLARKRLADWKPEAYSPPEAVGLLVLLAATDDLEGWFSVLEIDAEAEYDSKRADYMHDMGFTDEMRMEDHRADVAAEDAEFQS